MSLFSSLRREQRESIGLLQIGTFLEYFDLMLYVHMAVLLNDLFFPKTDPHTASLIAAFAFCSTYVLRPFGALLFGWIGDHIGRKTTVIITTMMMAVSCLIMANLPTYSQIGITAAWIITICRILQGLSSMGEIVGAQIYITEITKPPVQYPAVALIGVASVIGTMTALLIATLVTTQGFNWRLAFWIGAGIALVGSVARTRLRETPDFVDMKRRMKKAIEESSRDGLGKAADLLKNTNPLFKEKVGKKTGLSFLFLQMPQGVLFFFIYIYCGSLLKSKFGFTPAEIIHHNFMVSLFDLFVVSVVAYLSYHVNPLQIIKFQFFILSFFIVLMPYVLTHMISNSFDLFLVQVIFIAFFFGLFPAHPIIYNHIPIFKRFTYSAFTYALARALAYIITSFTFVYATESLGYYGLWVIMIPVSIMFLFGLKHFEKLEYETRHDNPETALRKSLTASSVR
jgi:MHS family proline/betaine transporter-like MFS transporter